MAENRVAEQIPMSGVAEGSIDGGDDRHGAPAPERSALAGFASADHKQFGVMLLVAFAALACLAGLRGGPPLGDHESINALVARYSMQSGDWLLPRLGDTPLVRKTPLGMWLIGAASYLTGDPTGSRDVTEFSARLPSAVAGFANVMAVFWLGAMLYGYRAGLTAGFICAGCAATMLYSRNAQVDMVLTSFTTLAFACFWRGAMHPQRGKLFMAAFYVAFALAMLAKAPLPLATVGLSLGVYWFLTVPTLAVGGSGEHGLAPIVRRWFVECAGQFARLRTLWLVPGLILFIVLVGAWPAYVYFNVDNALALWRIEYLDRFTGELSDKVRPFWYYIPIIFGLTAPYVASIPEAVVSPVLRRYAGQRNGLAFAFTWALVATVFLSAAAFKRPHYALSVVPAFCLLLAPVIERFFFEGTPVGRRSVRIVSMAIPTLLVLVGIAGGIYVGREYRLLLAPYVTAWTAACLVWSASCWTYARGQRVSSFALLNLGLPVILLIIWPAVGKRLDLNAEAKALTSALREHGVKLDDEVYWADKRPNASVEFYSGYRIRRLIDENEMAGLRDNRSSISEAAVDETVRRTKDKLNADHPVFLIFEAKRYELLARSGDIPGRVVLRVGGFHEHPGDDLVVVTQTAPSTDQTRVEE